MRRLIMAVFITAMFIGRAYAQKISRDTTSAHLKTEVKGDGINDIKDFYNQLGTSNDKQNFANILTGVAQFAGITDNGITLKANIVQLTSITENYQNSAAYYSSHTFARNFEIDLGGSPNNNNVLQYSKANAGFTYAILDNTYMREKDYISFENRTDIGIANKTIDALTQIMADEPTFENAIKIFLHDDSRKNKGLPNAVLDILLKKYKIADPATALSSAQTDFKEYVVKAKARPLLTLAPSFDYDGTRGWIADYGVKGNLTVYAFIFNKMKLPLAFSLQPSYSICKDTVRNTAFENRKIFGGTFSIDISPIVDPGTYKAVLEIKPQFGWTRTNGELFMNEKKDQFSFMTTVTYTVSKSFSIPIALKVTQKSPTLFGFLAIQYSL